MNKTQIGRKSDYSDEILVKTEHYLANHEAEGDLVPSVSGLSIYLGKARSTLYKWSKEDDKEEFSHLLEMVLTQQERLLLSGGLSGTFNASITKLMLAKHDYGEKQAQTVDLNQLTPWSEIVAGVDEITGNDFNELYSELEDSC